MKDYMMALNDDKEVLKTLVKNIGEKIEERFLKEINGKKEKLQHWLVNLFRPMKKVLKKINLMQYLFAFTLCVL